MKRARMLIAALTVAPILLGGCNQSNDQPKQQLLKASSNGIIQTPPPKDLPPPWEQKPGGGQESGTVKCRICPKYCEVPQYDSNGRASGTKTVQCGTESCDCGG